LLYWLCYLFTDIFLDVGWVLILSFSSLRSGAYHVLFKVHMTRKIIAAYLNRFSKYRGRHFPIGISSSILEILTLLYYQSISPEILILF